MRYVGTELLQACALRVYTTSINESLSLLARWNLHALVLHGTQVLRHTNRGPSVVHGYPEREGIYKVYWDVGWKHDWEVVHLGLTQKQQNKKGYTTHVSGAIPIFRGGWTPHAHGGDLLRQRASGAPGIEIMCKMCQQFTFFLKI